MFHFTSIKDYHQYLSGTADGCSIATAHYLNKIESNKHLNAFVEVYTNECIERAKWLDAKRKSGNVVGKLHGVIIALKDVICYKDHKVSASSGMLKNFVSL